MIFTNPIFWIIIIAILVLMAIVGYIAESMGLDNKQEPKILENDITNTSDVKPFETVSETATSEAAPLPDTKANVTEINSVQANKVETLNLTDHEN